MQTLPNTGTVRVKATITYELSLFSKFGGVTALEFGRGATVGSDPRDVRGQKDLVAADWLQPTFIAAGPLQMSIIDFISFTS
ncbi:hypothetical protein Acr_17g0001200 [Actinidia rufa]|uniref:Uncharacterized protein n=1 Tax=Actinidia rufa TaxID=165716 RepID=A0A7J0G188_9ERIC|nr:hypothetical protein Acr_17g0001200 [Actinidia rufa]